MRTAWWLRDEGQQWMAEAACSDSPCEWFFPEEGSPTEEARALCAGCPVSGECLEHALERNEAYGLWGGATASQRARIRRQRAQSERVRAECGTRSRYSAGCRCDQCRAANATYHRRRTQA